MSNWTKGLLTAAGRLLLAKVEVGSASLQFSRIELGSGVSSGDRSAATSLVSSRTSSGISSVIRDGESIKVTASFTSMNISSMFYVTEMGLYAKDPDVGDILFMVATDSAPDPMPSKTYNQPITFTYTMEVFVSSDLSITPKVSPEGLVTVSVMNDAIAKHNVDATAHSDLRASIEEYFEKMKLLVGAPLKAETAAKMTDTARIYVYTGSESGFTNGAWYYYDSSTSKWTYGGLYNESALETDKELKTSDYAADAKVVGDKLRDLESELKSGLILPADVNRRLELCKTAIKLKFVDIADNSKNQLTDDDGNNIGGYTYLPVTDESLEESDIPADAKAVGDAVGNLDSRTLTLEDALMNYNKSGQKVSREFINSLKKVKNPVWGYEYPVLYLSNVPGSLIAEDASKSSGGTAEDTVYYNFPYLHISGVLAKMKIQGSSSTQAPKKNYTLTFPTNFVAKDGWGSHKKYVIKANFIDFTGARNVCCAKLAGAMRKGRVLGHLTDNIVDANNNILANSSGDSLTGACSQPYNIGMNYGSIDGFPISVFINGIYWGMYTFSIPKDDWMAMMKSDDNQAIISPDHSATNAQVFKGLATMKESDTGYADWSIEYQADDFTDSEILSSLNTAISAVLSSHSTAQEYIDAISPYIDIDSAIDWYIFSALIANWDGISKNTLLQTWDGKKWYFTPYDLDCVIGQASWQGTQMASAKNSGQTFSAIASAHRVAHILYTYDTADLISRYEVLRNSVLSESNVYEVFANYMGIIPKSVYDNEIIRWPTTPFSSVKDLNQIVDWYKERCILLDAEITDLKKNLISSAS